MILNVAVLIGVLAVAVVWALRGNGRGLLSSFLAALATVLAGAVAFALWEPLVYGLDGSGLLLDLQPDLAFTLGLLIPFILAAGVLRLAVELAVPKNMDFGDVGNFVGGAGFGLVNGVVTLGIIVVALSFLRVGPTLGGFSPVDDKAGNLVVENNLWIPVDDLTVGLYEHLSTAAFASPDPLAERLPAVHDQAAMARRSFEHRDQGESSFARAVIGPDQFTIVGEYRVAGPTNELFAYPGQDRTQNVLDVTGEPWTGRVEIAGYLVEFDAGAFEKSGQFIIGPGQARLIYRDGPRVGVSHPFAIVGESEAGSVARFPLDTDDVFVPSVGGASAVTLGLEFPVPAGAAPVDLIIKNVRRGVDEPDTPRVAYADSAQRDAAVSTGSLFSDLGVAMGGLVLTDLDRSGAATITSGRRGFDEISVGDRLPERYVLNKTTGTGGLETDGPVFINGRGQFSVEQFQARGLDENLRGERLASKRDTSVVQIQLATGGTFTALGRAAARVDADVAPLLVDSENRAYRAIGWLYSDGSTVDLRYTPGDTIDSIEELPERLSTTKRGQTAYLFFQVTSGAEVSGFVFGNQLVAEFSPPVRVR